MPRYKSPLDLALAEVKQLKELLAADIQRHATLLQQRDALKGQLDLLSHEKAHAEQTIRSLHWALNVAVRHVADAQKAQGMFSAKQWLTEDDVRLAV